MRISTAMVYTKGVNAIQKQQADQVRTQQQISSGMRILSPADDPVGTAAVLELTQYSGVNSQNIANANVITNKLQTEETSLWDVGSLIQGVKEIAIEAGSGILSTSDRESLATSLQGMYQDLLGVANTTDEAGQYLFSGFMGNTAPFTETTPGTVAYNGDQGQREIRLGSQRQIAVSDPGADIFQRIKNGNGTFVTAATSAPAPNAGTGLISVGNVLDAAKWNSAANNKDFMLKFDVSAANPPVTTYDIIDNVTGNSLLTGALPGVAPYPRTYTSGSTISLKSQGAEPAFDFGAELTINGDPATNDTFTVKASTNEDIFTTITNMIATLRTPVSVNQSIVRQNGLNTAMANLNNALDNVLTVHATVGARMNEVTSVQSTQSDLNIQYQAQIGQIQNVDMAQAISDFTLQNTQLQAALQSFSKTQSLSLFNYIQ